MITASEFERLTTRIARLEKVFAPVERMTQALDGLSPGWDRPLAIPESELPPARVRDSLAPSPDYALGDELPEPEPCGCDESQVYRDRIRILEERLAVAENELAYANRIADRFARTCDDYAKRLGILRIEPRAVGA